jgi:sensor c-di-GMP phosphodiesterase-like protein
MRSGGAQKVRATLHETDARRIPAGAGASYGRDMPVYSTVYWYTGARHTPSQEQRYPVRRMHRSEEDGWHMRKSTAIFLTIITALVAVAVPILLAIHVARSEALNMEQERALGYARDVLTRAEVTATQLAAGIDMLDRSGTAPCSEENVALMRRMDLASTNIQAAGYVSGTRLVCSSLGKELANIELGPVEVVHSNGVKLRNAVELPFAPTSRFIVVEYKNYAVFIHKDTMFQRTTGVGAASLALVEEPQKLVLTARGHIDPRWIRPGTPGTSYTVVDGEYVVGAVQSGSFHLIGLSAVPIAQLNAHARAVTREMLPIGIVIGLLLAFVVYQVARHQMALPSILKGALRRDEFYLEYLPIIELRTGRLAGAEALIRWRRPGGELVPPDDFIPVAERNGVITLITERVIELVCRDARMLFERFPDFHVAINLAPEDLHDPLTVARLQRLAERTQARPGNMMVEATERGLIEPALAGGIIDQIRHLGIAVAIDDFGTGYSSLASLQSFNLDYLKIDQSFVQTLGTDAATGTVALHIIEMAKALNLQMIAEGVGTEAQAASLRDHGVQFAQGWLFAKPMAVAELVAMIERARGAGRDRRPQVA